MSARSSLLACALTLTVCALPLHAQTTADAEVISVRGDRIYLELNRPLELEPGDSITIRPSGGQAFSVRALAASTKYLTIEADDVRLAPGDAVVVEGGQSAPPPDPGPSGQAGGEVVIGRPILTEQDYQTGPLPEVEKVQFQRRETTSPPPGPDTPPDPNVDTPPPTPGVTPGETGPPVEPEANVVRGELEFGFDSLFDEDADINRVTPYTRLRLEVDKLGGSDRSRFVFYGSLRQPFGGEQDWTGSREGHLTARISALNFEMDARTEEQVQSFSDRIELGVGRQTIPGMVEAGLVDGVRAGVRLGPAIGFGFMGWGVSPNPQNEDYESFIYGGGLRLTYALAHSGAIRFTFGAAQELFRGDGERDFLETSVDARYGKYGFRGRLVIDFFDQLRDRRDTRLTTGSFSIYAQFTPEVRAELGYRERRPAWQADLLRGGRGDLAFAAFPFLNDDERRNVYAAVYWSISDAWRVSARPDYQFSPDARDSVGFALGSDWDLTTAHHLRLDMSVRHRLKGDGYTRHATEPFVSVTYRYSGELWNTSLGAFYRTTVPSEVGDSRLGLRASGDVDLSEDWSLRGYFEVEFRRTSGQDDSDAAGSEVVFLGLSARYRF